MPSIRVRPPRKRSDTERGLARSPARAINQGRGETQMKMVSYWKDKDGVYKALPDPFYDEDGKLFLIYGYYDHRIKVVVSKKTCRNV